MDIKDILYNEIDKMGKNNIRAQLSNNVYNSKSIINLLFNKCAILLNKDNPFEDEFVLFGEALLHFLLTMAMIPAERKIIVDDIDIDILVPNSRNLKQDNEKAIIIHFIKDKKENIENTIKKISNIQKNLDNIWFVSSKHIDLKLKTFIVSPLFSHNHNDDSNSIYHFSEILVKIDEFLKNINYSGLKIF